MLNKAPKWTLAILLSLVLSATSWAAPPKPRIIVLTDISPNNVEPDDMESMIRLLVHADLFEIEGLVATTGWSNSGGQERPDLIHDAINAYEEDLPNLRKRSNQDGHRADEKDERPVWVLAWGGGNTFAQAIWRVREDRTAEQLKAFLYKIRFYTITDQDRAYERGTPYDISSHQWMRREFEKDLRVLWDESAWTYQNGTGKANWDRHAAEIQGHGHLGTMYPKYRFGVDRSSVQLCRKELPCNL